MSKFVDDLDQYTIDLMIGVCGKDNLRFELSCLYPEYLLCDYCPLVKKCKSYARVVSNDYKEE